MISNKYHWIHYEMYFHNKWIRSHKHESYSLETWSNVNYFYWHATRSCILFWTVGYFLYVDLSVLEVSVHNHSLGKKKRSTECILSKEPIVQ
jgi:hypothetical protein